MADIINFFLAKAKLTIVLIGTLTKLCINKKGMQIVHKKMCQTDRDNYLCLL